LFVFGFGFISDLIQHKKRDPWPGSRYYHSAACVGYRGQHKRLIFSGGVASLACARYDDMWLLDPQTGRTSKVRIFLVN